MSILHVTNASLNFPRMTSLSRLIVLIWRVGKHRGVHILRQEPSKACLPTLHVKVESATEIFSFLLLRTTIILHTHLCLIQLIHLGHCVLGKKGTSITRGMGLSPSSSHPSDHSRSGS